MSFKSHPHQFCNSELLQFPQPTRPMFSYSSISTSSMPENSLSPQFAVEPPKTTATVTEEEEKEAVDELLRILVECLEEVSTKSRELLLRKFFDDFVKEETSLEGLVKQRLQRSKAKSISEELFRNFPASGVNQTSTQRGLEVDSSAMYNFNTAAEDQLSHRLERFKIRTPNLDFIVKDEPKANSETKTS